MTCCKYWNSDSKTARKKGMGEVDCLVWEKIFPRQAVVSWLTLHPPFAPSAQCKHQVKPCWFSGISPALPRRLRAVDNWSRVMEKSSFRPSSKWNSLMAPGRDFRWAKWPIRESSGCLIRTLHVSQGKMHLFHWNLSWQLLLRLSRRSVVCDGVCRCKEVFGWSEGKKDAGILNKEVKATEHFAIGQTLHKSTHGGIQKRELGS